MKFIICSLLLFFGLNTFAQEKSNNCEVSLTKEAFLINPLPSSCFNSEEVPTISSMSYKIKFPGHPSLNIIRDSLSRKFKFYVETAQKTDNITIFDIKLEDKTIVTPKSIVIKITD